MLLEDFGALIGLVIALTAVSLTTVTGNADFDGIGTIAIGVLLVVIAIVLAREMKSLLIGEAASDTDIDGHDEGHRRIARASCASSICDRSTSVPTSWSSPQRSSSPTTSRSRRSREAIDEVEARSTRRGPDGSPAVRRARRASLHLDRIDRDRPTDPLETARRATLEEWPTTKGFAIT